MLKRALALPPDHELVVSVHDVRDAVTYPDGYTSAPRSEERRMRLRRTHAAVDIYEPEDMPHPMGNVGTSPPEVVAAARAKCEAEGKCYNCGKALHEGQPCWTDTR